jgi:hypothetical protein
MLQPSQKNYFIDHPDLMSTHEKISSLMILGTSSLWMELRGSPEIEKLVPPGFFWNRMLFHGLSLFFTDTAGCYAYWLSLMEVGIEDPSILLFHGNNAVVRVIACWDRMGYCLNQLFELGITEYRVSFKNVLKEISKLEANNHPNLDSYELLVSLFTKSDDLVAWRNKYLHRYGEYYSIENEGNLTSEYFPWSKEDKAEIQASLRETLPDAFVNLKKAMILCSALYPEIHQQ